MCLYFNYYSTISGKLLLVKSAPSFVYSQDLHAFNGDLTLDLSGK